jgi:hypothetical protein
VPHMNIGAIGGYKGVGGESKEISSGKIEPVEEAILNYCAFNGSRFKAAYVVNWIMEKGLTKGLNGESSRLKLLKRVHDAIQRLARESGLGVGGYIKAIIREYLKSRGVLEKSLESRVSDLEARVKRLEELLARGQRGDLGGGEY